MGVGRGAHPSSDSQQRFLTGHMLQLFVNRNHVKDIAYLSHPMGVPIFERGVGWGAQSFGVMPNVRRGGTTSSGNPLADLWKYVTNNRSGEAGGQARILADPQVWTDPSITRMYHYCAWPELLSESTDPGAGLTRGNMHVEMTRALAPILNNVERRRRAIRAIGEFKDGHPCNEPRSFAGNGVTLGGASASSSAGSASARAGSQHDVIWID